MSFREAGHKCEDTEKVLEGMKVFLITKVALDAEGNIKAIMHAHPEELKEFPREYRLLAKAITDTVVSELTRTLEVATVATEIKDMLEHLLNPLGEKATEPNDDNESDRQSAETSGVTGELKQHGRTVH